MTVGFVHAFGVAVAVGTGVSPGPGVAPGAVGVPGKGVMKSGGAPAKKFATKSWGVVLPLPVMSSDDTNAISWYGDVTAECPPVGTSVIWSSNLRCTL